MEHDTFRVKVSCKNWQCEDDTVRELRVYVPEQESYCPTCGFRLTPVSRSISDA